jgi:hypothetical protein
MGLKLQMKQASLLGLLVLLCASPSLGFAQNAELEQIRRQLMELRNDYESRLRALEDQLRAAEDLAKSSQQRASEAAAAAERAENAATQAQNTPVASAQAPPTQTALNPTISVILNGTWGLYENDPAAQITGFLGSGASEILPRGASLGESELFLSASVDPYFRGSLMAALTPDNELEVEEAFFETLSLGGGFTLKGGRFLSGMGYWNAQHPHAWDFTDASLVQRAFLGNNYGDDGLQLRWVAPLPFFLQLGTEVGRGREFAGMGEIERNGNGADSWALFAKAGGDIGTSYSWQLGVSHLRQKTESEGVPLFDYDDLSGLQNRFAGRQRIWGADLVIKWAPDGNPLYQNFRFVTEYYRRKLDGQFTFDTAGWSQTDAAAAAQSGWYAQGVYQFHPYWRAGLRYDRLSSGTVDLSANAANLPVPDFDAKRWTVMTDYNPSEFSRIRVELSEGHTRRDPATGETVSDTIAFVQYVFSLGAHGAHQF